METWFLVAAIYHGGEVSTSFGKPVTLGPMPSMEVCLDVAQSMERAAKGNIMAGCTFQYEAATGGPTFDGGPRINGCTTLTCNNSFAR